MKKFKLNKDIQGVYTILKKGYTHDLDYPNYYYEDTGELGICEGHGDYTWVNKDDYEIIGRVDSGEQSSLFRKQY